MNQITAKIDLTGLQFPVLLDPTFEAPNWFRNTSNQPSAVAAAASAYDNNSKCVVLFGGYSSVTATTVGFNESTPNSKLGVTSVRWAAPVDA